MRKGVNPQKKQDVIEVDSIHRIILVVYIPNNISFYKNSFEVFKLCLESLIKTINSQAKITVVNNGSNEQVTQYIYKKHQEKYIDTLIHHNTNIGKIDALLGAARGAREKYITLSDADVLFKTGWMEEVTSVFNNFKNVGSVSPISVRNAETYATSSGMLKVLTKQLKFEYKAIPENFEDFNRYMSSINWDLETKPNLKWPVVESNSIKANLGSGHQVLTIDRDLLFSYIPTSPSYILIGRNSVNDFIDDPINKSGKLRLSTYNNFAYHMGNTVEKWMVQVQEENMNNINNIEIKDYKLTYPFKLTSHKIYTLKRLFIKKLFLLFFKR
ncbi:glycosyltransferase family 2 protein [Olleya aquimaris]|uniref:Glycosyltransferase family 2 protein n=1 Tax=Olleya sediminilitoris TaxID=2795739 RepID=A0ABS1WKQ4_9FLAO|nr:MULTISPECIES: glycosyltransferase family A protein [Olleya]AXO81599.1 glycosyltransferase family 2 protein [Olleya aquimaris]MBL7559699.1 glycosyltransferase family 2 protein [Olleya sediminilitoris]